MPEKVFGALDVTCAFESLTTDFPVEPWMCSGERYISFDLDVFSCLFEIVHAFVLLVLYFGGISTSVWLGFFAGRKRVSWAF